MVDKLSILQEFFNEKGIKLKCSICSHAPLEVLKEDTALVILGSNDSSVMGKPVQAFLCPNCGFVRLFNPSILGLSVE